jgi:hypothetical protein
MRIAILLPMVWSVRNVVHGGVMRALVDAGVEVHLIVRGWDGMAGRTDRRLFEEAAGCHALLDVAGPAVRGKAWLEAVLSSAFHHRHRNRSHPIYRRWFSRHDGPWLRVRATAIEGARRVFYSKSAIARLEGITQRLDRKARNLEPVRQQLRALAPDLLWSTVNISSLEQPYRFAARDMGIPIATSILSFDNLTSRGPLPRDDYYLVWGPGMRAHMARFYPDIDESRVFVTGTPQFDFHRWPTCTWSRERTLSALGLSPRTRYFLYGASHAALTPEEPLLVSQLASRMKGHSALRHHTLVVRLHPLDDSRRWAIATDREPQVRLSAPFEATSATDGWAMPSADDYSRLTSSLAHADGCINIASTLSLDAAILDRPVICLDFRTEPDAPRDMLFGEYETEHYAPLVASGGLRVARTWAELLDLMATAISEPARDRARRAAMVAEACGTVDGRAGQRVARTLMQLANEARLSRGGLSRDDARSEVTANRKMVAAHEGRAR